MALLIIRLLRLMVHAERWFVDGPQDELWARPRYRRKGNGS